jgi:hypothetical protein
VKIAAHADCVLDLEAALDAAEIPLRRMASDLNASRSSADEDSQ